MAKTYRVSPGTRLTNRAFETMVNLAEQGADDSVPVLRQYLREVPITRPYFDATPGSTDEQIAAEVPRHPVFALLPEGTASRSPHPT